MAEKSLREPKFMRVRKTYQSPILPEEITVLEYIAEGKTRSLFQQDGEPRVIMLRICG